MAWTAPATAVTGDVIPAAFWNVNGRDNLNALHDVLSGAAQAFGGTLYPTSDAQFFLRNDPLINFDANDYVVYDRVNNKYKIRVAGADALTVGSQRVEFAGDASYYATLNGAGVPFLGLDTAGGFDYFQFVRATNLFQFAVNSVVALQIDSNGKLTGSGFYDSGEFAIGAGAMTDLLHGFGAMPRFYFGASSTVAGAAKLSPMTYNTGAGLSFIDSTASTSIRVKNYLGFTVYGRVYAML